MKSPLKVGLAVVALLLACLGAFAARAANNMATLYAVTNLGPGSAYKASNPDVGGTFLVAGSTPATGGTARATVWTLAVDGSVIDVFMYDQSLGSSAAVDVNDDGMVIGNSQLGSFVDVPGVGIRFLDAIQVERVNNQGVVVGSTPDPSGPDHVSGAMWYVDPTGGITGPVLTTIGPGVTFMPLDINDDGTMAGLILTAGSSNTTAAVAEFDDHGELDVTDLGVLHPGDTGAAAWSINIYGLVAGGSNGKTTSEFLWDPSHPNKLASLGGGLTSPDINDSAQIVFSTVNKANVTVGVIWRNGKTTDLNSVLTASLNDTIALALGINNTGHIVGLTQSGNAFVLTPQ